MSYIISHSRLGFCWWDLVALAILLIVIGVFAYKHREMKKIEKELQDQISEQCADNTVQIEETT